MSLFKKLMKGKYKAFARCPNCGFGSEINIPRGVSVADFIKGGSCKCDSCGVVFYPKEYTTEHFEKQKNKELVIKGIEGVYKPEKNVYKENPPQKKKEDIKWL